MKGRAALLPGIVSILFGSVVLAAEHDGEPPATGHMPLPHIAVEPLPHAFQPHLGAGYVPYSYPAFETCPCGNDGCFHSAWYYCGGKEYRRAWFGKWLRAHAGHGSMLDGYPCQCVFPTAGKPYLISPPVPPAQPEPTPVPPPPAPVK